MHVESLDHIHIYSADPEASAGFYLERFEAQEISRNLNANGDLRIFLALGGQIVVIGVFPAGMVAAIPPVLGDGAYRHGFGIAHFGLRVGDVSAAISELEGEGVPILSEPVVEKSGLTYAYIVAPDGVVIELTQY